MIGGINSTSSISRFFFLGVGLLLTYNLTLVSVIPYLRTLISDTLFNLAISCILGN